MRTLAADIVLVVHFAFAAFVVSGLLLTWIGAACGWRWVRNRRFRLAHAAAIVFVALEALAGVMCPLTVLEDMLRGSLKGSGFIARWVGRMLYHDLPAWAFTTAYVAWAAATIATWLLVPPRPRVIAAARA